MNNILLKTLYDKRGFVIGWSIGLAFLSFLMVIFYPAFKQDNALEALAENLPPALQGIIGNLENLKQLPSYLGSQLFEIRIPIFVSVMAIILGTSLTVAEEEKGQLRTLLSFPVSRANAALGKWVAVVLIGFIAVLSLIIGAIIGVYSISETIDILVLARLGAMTWLLFVALATIVLGVGLASGKRGLTTTIGSIVAIGSFILTTFATSVQWLDPYQKFSILHYFPAADIAKDQIHFGDAIVLLSVTILFLLLGLVFFRRRDVN